MYIPWGQKYRYFCPLWTPETYDISIKFEYGKFQSLYWSHFYHCQNDITGDFELESTRFWLWWTMHLCRVPWSPIDFLWCSMMFYNGLWYSLMFFDVLWCSMMFRDVFWLSLMFYDVLRYSLMFFDVLWCSWMFYDVLWCSMMFFDVLWCSMMFYDVLWCSLMFYDVLWCSMMFFDILWSSMMFYDVLCLKSIFGFLLSERTSGVAPVIFLFHRVKVDMKAGRQVIWSFITGLLINQRAARSVLRLINFSGLFFGSLIKQDLLPGSFPEYE